MSSIQTLVREAGLTPTRTRIRERFLRRWQIIEVWEVWLDHAPAERSPWKGRIKAQGLLLRVYGWHAQDGFYMTVERVLPQEDS